jgi:hypothetical protein
VVDTVLQDGVRVVTFGNEMVQREPIVTCDDEERRLVYTAVDSPLGATHYNGAVLVSGGAGDGTGSSGGSMSSPTRSPNGLIRRWKSAPRR